MEIGRLIAMYARMTRADIQDAVQNPKTPMLEVAIASIFAQCAKTGDYTRLAFLLDRSIGRVAVVEIDGEYTSPLTLLTEEQLLELVDKKKQILIGETE